MNGLLVVIRPKRISSERARRFVQDLIALPIKSDAENGLGVFAEVFAYAQAYKLTAYDASYLELAHRTRTTLATRDADLRQAALAVNVPVL